MYRKPSSGAGTGLTLYSASRGDRFVLASVADQTSGYDIWMIPLDGGKPHPFLETPAHERDAGLSADERWLAYASNETGQYQVYVLPFPGKEGKFQISSEGGRYPVWSRDGRTLFYRAADILMEVEVKAGDRFGHAPPRELFSGNFTAPDLMSRPTASDCSSNRDLRHRQHNP